MVPHDSKSDLKKNPIFFVTVRIYFFLVDALNCIQCGSAENGYQCENESGTSILCPEEVTACTKFTCDFMGYVGMIFKGCADSSELDEPMGCQTNVIILFFFVFLKKIYSLLRKYLKNNNIFSRNKMDMYVNSAFVILMIAIINHNVKINKTKQNQMVEQFIHQN